MADFSRLLKTEFRWPKASDVAFTSSEEWDRNATIDSHGHGRLVMMMVGYKEGADLMVAKAQEDSSCRDSLVYPIVFNYRQFLELNLKYLIHTYGRTVGVKSIWDTHKLEVLWEAFLKVLDGYGDDDPGTARADVGKIIGEFAKIDPNSFSFRYPVDTKGKLVALGRDDLDLVVLADVMKAVEGFFSGCDGWLDAGRG
jgi:hypothetical protein